jgi:hypothetical protein
MKTILDELHSDLERAENLQNILVAIATGGGGNPDDYQAIRKFFVDNPSYKSLVPSFVRTSRDTNQFWQFIKYKFGSYAERRQFIWNELSPLMDYLEGKNNMPADESISDGLKSFDEEGVQSVWMKALERRVSDPDGAITISRTLLETVCKHILDDLNISYNPQNAEMHELYKLVANELNLSTDQHTEKIFKQILGGCSAVVNGLGTLRNKLGDAHGQGRIPVKAAPRHAELAVNLSGAMAIFLISTWKISKGKTQ